MAAPVVRRRRDGIVQIRPRRTRDVVSARAAVVLLTMMAGWLLFSTALVAALVAAPLLLAVVGAIVILGVWGGWLVRPSGGDTPTVEPPHPGAA